MLMRSVTILRGCCYNVSQLTTPLVLSVAGGKHEKEDIGCRRGEIGQPDMYDDIYDESECLQKAVRKLESAQKYPTRSSTEPSQEISDVGTNRKTALRHLTVFL